ncbi:MAG: hypothetical protein ACRDSF_00260 [Pseudonocardiaceae bacterium]
MKSVMQCGLNAIAEPIAGTPEALKRATQVYREIDSTDNVLEAFESVYKKGLPVFTYEEQAEALFILSGLDSCGEAGATTSGALALLLSGQPISDTDRNLLNKPADFSKPADPNKQVSDSTKRGGDSSTPGDDSSAQKEKAAADKAAEELDKQKQAELDKQKQAELDKQKQAELDKQKQAELDKQKQAELDKQKQAELDKQKQAELDKQKQAELDKQKQEELDKQTEGQTP